MQSNSQLSGYTTVVHQMQCVNREIVTPAQPCLPAYLSQFYHTTTPLGSCPCSSTSQAFLFCLSSTTASAPNTLFWKKGFCYTTQIITSSLPKVHHKGEQNIEPSLLHSGQGET